MLRALSAAVVIACAAPALAQQAGQPTLLGQYGDWGAYTANPGGKKVCFALSKPTKATTNPPNRPRDPSYMFVSTRPSEKVKDEISVVVGYPQKPNFEAALEVAGSQYAMYTQNDGAWIKNAAEEARLVEALRKGTDVVVRSQSSRGTKTADTYSLKGLAQALDKIWQECR
jgi:invasion protein IalB